MKKVIFLALIFLLCAGVVSASSINGDYHGDPIVKITSNGNELNIPDVPAIIYHGRTMVPLSLLKQLGAEVSWDQKTYTADVKLTQKDVATKEKTVDVWTILSKLKSIDQLPIRVQVDGQTVDLSQVKTEDELKEKAREIQKLLDHAKKGEGMWLQRNPEGQGGGDDNDLKRGPFWLYNWVYLPPMDSCLKQIEAEDPPLCYP
jgi:hypothetical protein